MNSAGGEKKQKKKKKGRGETVTMISMIVISQNYADHCSCKAMLTALSRVSLNASSQPNFWHRTPISPQGMKPCTTTP